MPPLGPVFHRAWRRLSTATNIITQSQRRTINTLVGLLKTSTFEPLISQYTEQRLCVDYIFSQGLKTARVWDLPSVRFDLLAHFSLPQKYEPSDHFAIYHSFGSLCFYRQIIKRTLGYSNI